MPIMMLAIMVSMIGGAEMPIVVEDHRCLGKRPLGHESSYFREDNERWDDHSAFMRILGAMETRARADRTKISRRTVEAAVPSYQEWV